jgi:hypothetical protein
MYGELLDLEARLRASGLADEADEVHELVEEAEALERPASWLQRMRGKVGNMARSQWQRVQQELEETREVYGLLRQRANREIDELDPVQKEKIRAQLLDLFKVVPGGALAVANFVAPIPMSSWLTPALLINLGLMPSAWKEAHVSHRLLRLMRKLEERGQLDQAHQVEEILEDIVTSAAHRERMGAIAADRKLLSLYDRNQDGTLDAAEQATLHGAMDRVVRALRGRWGARIWYLYREGDVCGPFTLPDIDALGCSEDTLLCRGGTKRWVPLRWVLQEVEDLDRGVSGTCADPEGTDPAGADPDRTG